MADGIAGERCFGDRACAFTGVATVRLELLEGSH
jgi:hypothetical protein